MSGSSFLASARRDDLGLHAEIAAAGMRHLQPVEPLGRVGELQPAGQVQAAGLAGDRLDLLVEADGIGLQLGDVGVAVQRVEAARRMPGRARGQLAPLDQHHVAPAGLGEMIEHRAADDAAADHRDLDMGFHEVAPLGRAIHWSRFGDVLDVEQTHSSSSAGDVGVGDHTAGETFDERAAIASLLASVGKGRHAGDLHQCRFIVKVLTARSWAMRFAHG